MGKRFILTCLMAVAFMLLTACGGVDHSDPRNIAEHAMKYYRSGDYEGLKSLINPEDEYKLERFERMSNANVKEKQVSKFEFIKATEDITGCEITENSKCARVEFEAEDFPRIVILERKNGKWYWERFKQH